MAVSPIGRIYIRLPNWIGDVCMSLPSLHAVIATGCEVIVCAKPWAQDLLKGFTNIGFIPLTGKWSEDRKRIKQHRQQYNTDKQSVGLLLPDSLTSALTFRLAGLACAGYKDDGRQLLLKWAFDKPKESLHAVESWYRLTYLALSAWGFSPEKQPNQALSLPLTIDHYQQAHAVVTEALANKPFILIAPTATGKHHGREKVWPFFDTLTKKLQSEGFTVAMCPPPNEKEMALQNAPTAQLLPPVSLGAFVALLEKASVVICNDSGVSHLASISAKHQITLIGVTEAERTGPWSSKAIILGKMNHWPSVEDVNESIKKVV
ncbi:heptosyltransferase [Pelistega indica]|uniref:Heptosyltransferase n=1 Tax=Pelistega indica TaxID=1414851 RepID=V8G938_9BURK|nr:MULTISPECIES: glycosyltransferase family 9 protein [Pelistega]ETD72940.1 heptosyltransferase [Pelistega indica]